MRSGPDIDPGKISDERVNRQMGVAEAEITVNTTAYSR
jgi:hypothetical protein